MLRGVVCLLWSWVPLVTNPMLRWFIVSLTILLLVRSHLNHGQEAPPIMALSLEQSSKPKRDSFTKQEIVLSRGISWGTAVRAIASLPKTKVLVPAMGRRASLSHPACVACLQFSWFTVSKLAVFVWVEYGFISAREPWRLSEVIRQLPAYRYRYWYWSIIVYPNGVLCSSFTFWMLPIRIGIEDDSPAGSWPGNKLHELWWCCMFGLLCVLSVLIVLYCQ